MIINEDINKIKATNKDIKKISLERWDSIAKPLRSLGTLEEAIVKICGIQESLNIDISKKALVIMCADNGVVSEGVTQTEMEVTRIVTQNFTKEKATVSIMAKSLGVDVFPIDIGVYKDIENSTKPSESIKPFAVNNRKVSYGTKNIYKEAAMSKEDVKKAINIGIDIVKELKELGYNIVATGEMGIGNTTTSSAITTVLLQKEVEEVTGRGAGLTKEGLNKKIHVIKEAIQINNPIKDDPLDVLRKLGGLDIAGLVGVFLGGGIYKIPVVIDGFISAVAALIAYKVNPLVMDYIFPSHVSKEPAGKMLLDELRLKPFLNCEMCLGEGSGAILLFPILESACAVYKKMGTFNDEVFHYKPLYDGYHS